MMSIGKENGDFLNRDDGSYSKVKSRSQKKVRIYKEKLDCLKRAIVNAKGHVLANDPSRIYSQYIRYALDEFKKNNFYISKEAIGLRRSDVVHEHVVPHSIVMNKLLSIESLTDENIEAVLRRYYAICVITKDENQRLTDAGFKSEMPPGWDEKTGSIFARYEHERVQISIMKKA